MFDFLSRIIFALFRFIEILLNFQQDFIFVFLLFLAFFQVLVFEYFGTPRAKVSGTQNRANVSVLLYNENHSLGEWFKRSLMAIM